MFDMAAFMVVRDDAFYVDLALESVYPYVKGIYIQDQMSTDGTHEKIFEFMKKKAGKALFSIPKIMVDFVDTGGKGRFDPNYDEPKWRTLALKSCEWAFKPKWILKLDADEIYTPYFFRGLRSVLDSEIIEESPFDCIRVSGERFVSKDYIAGQLQDELCNYERSPDGTLFIDVHTQVWRAGRYYYVQNPNFPDSFNHPVLEPDPPRKFWLPGICNIHLHRIFGPKSVKFWQEGGEKLSTVAPYPPHDCPKWFNSRVNMGCAYKVDFKWPDYVLKRWAEWSRIW